ncbi:hypothetical protein SELMODRAFT_403163 [Selaginella moellendorffii]|uniref:Uncharacterized protein n=1 Tax=Selaginella moellendorffii TaxID=88036 RepID=D8QP91_SELML|nr:hypothetical protein SELMODRAFT_403163 [Selaginella moellendorffii]
MPQRKRRGQPQWSRSPGKGSRLDRCGLGRLSGDSSQVSNEVSASHAGGNDEYNNDVDVEMNTQIDVGVIEAVGTGVPEAAGTGGGVLASDVGGGGGAMPSVAEAARGQVNEPAEDVIGSVVGGSTTEATGGMVAAPTAPQAGGAGGANGGEGLCMHDSDTILNDRVRDTIIQAQERTVSKVLQEMAWNGPHRFLVPLCRLVQSHWVRSAYDLNMAIYSSFAEVGFGSTAAIRVKLGARIGQELQTWYQLPLDFLVAVWAKIRMEKVMKEKAYISQSIAAGEEMLQVWDEKFLSSTPHRYLKYSPGAPVYTTGVLQKLLTRGKKLGMYEPEFYCPCTHERELCPWYLELVEQMPTSDFELDLYLECHPEALSDCDNDIVEVQQLNLEVSTQETIQKMPNPNTVEPEEIVQEIPAQEIPVPAPRNPRRGRHETFHENVAESSHQSFRRTKTFFPSLPTATDDDLEELSSAAMHKQVRPLSPTASVGEVAILIGDYTQLLDATSRELYMLDRWIHGLGQLTPYGKIDFIFFDLPDGMAPPQGDTPSWNVLQAQHISQALKVASSFMTYEGVVVMILPRSPMWEGLLAHLADNDDGFVEFSSGCLLSSMAVDTKGTSRQTRKTKRLVHVEPIIYMSLWNTLNT